MSWKVTISGTDSAGNDFDETGELRNLSSTGAFISLAKQLSIGSKIDVRIRLPFQKENWMTYQAEVVRVENGQLNVGTGIRFCGIWPTFLSK